MTVYMRVSRDKYELPEAVSDRYKGRPGYVAVSIEEGAEDD